MDKEKNSHSYYPPDFPCYGKENYLKIREMNFHYLSWGDEKKPILFLLHGFLDHSHTFDLLAEKLMNDFHIIAWDARGFGRTDWVHPGGYYHFSEYLLDLELFIGHFNSSKIFLAGHSMGGMIASLYAGLFPEKVNKLINMEGWMVDTGDFNEAPERTRLWIEGMKSHNSFKAINDIREAARRIQKYDPLMADNIAAHLAYEGTKSIESGLYWRHDPIHRTRSPQAPYLGQIKAYWQKIEAPVLLMAGAHSPANSKKYQERISFFDNHQYLVIENAAHNLHLHQPEIISRHIREFLMK